MEINDIIKQTMLMEVDGVAVSNSFFYTIKDNTLATTVEALALDIHNDWWDKLKDSMSTLVATVCSVWENLNGNDPTFAIFNTVIGLNLGANLPADNIVVVTRKAMRSDDKVATGSIQLSGISTFLQDDGHLTDYEIGLGLENWMKTDQAYGPTLIRNVQPSRILGVNEYNEVQVAQTNPHIKKRLGRRSFLCKSLS
jgi:hypothetical protein